jgi:hypothetical protein
VHAALALPCTHRPPAPAALSPQARLHPEQPVADLGPDHVEALHRAIVYVIDTSVKVRADADKYPKGWMFHYRWAG